MISQAEVIAYQQQLEALRAVRQPEAVSVCPTCGSESVDTAGDERDLTEDLSRGFTGWLKANFRVLDA